MKKTFIVAMLVFSAVTAFSQPRVGAGLLDTTAYGLFFGAKDANDAIKFQQRYLDAAYPQDIVRFSNLGGYDEYVDTPLEFALLSYYSPPLITMRPAGADQMLPRNNPKQADLRLGAAVFQEMQVLRFLESREALARHERVLKYITDRGWATRDEIVRYYQEGIRGLMNIKVDSQFNYIDFTLRKSGSDISFDAVLKREAENRFVLSYGTGNAKTLSASSLDALLAEMGKNKTDFDQSCIDTVRNQSAAIPTVVFARANVNNDILGVLKGNLTQFYLSPTSANYMRVLELYDFFMWYESSNSRDTFFRLIRNSFFSVIVTLNEPLSWRLSGDAGAAISEIVVPQNVNRGFQNLKAYRVRGR